MKGEIDKEEYEAIKEKSREDEGGEMGKFKANYSRNECCRER